MVHASSSASLNPGLHSHSSVFSESHDERRDLLYSINSDLRTKIEPCLIDRERLAFQNVIGKGGTVFSCD